MHELSLCRAILDMVNEQTTGKNHTRVTKITLELGQLAAVDASALRFGFEAITKGTIAEDADLNIINIEGKARCETCQKTVTLKHYYDACDICGHFSLTVTQGEALRLKSIEVV